MDFEDCIISEENGKYFYNRYVHKSQKDVCLLLERQYGFKANIFPSGMNAIATAFQVLFMENKWQNVNVVFGNELYCDTPRTIKYLSESYVKLNMFKIKVQDDANVMDVFNNQIDKSLPTILFIESCSNPNGYIFNFDLLAGLKDSVKNLRVIVDNTWLTSVIFNPFVFDGVDIVVMSLTKYYGADKSGIMGAVVCRNDEIADRVFNYGRIIGSHVCPLYCKEMVRAIETMGERVRRTSEMTLEVARYLKGKNIPVSYPKLEDHISYERARKYFLEFGPSVLTLSVRMRKEEALKWMRSSKFVCSTSFGASDTRFDQWPMYSKKHSTCRLSIGFDDNLENILEELDRLLFAPQ